MMRRVAITGIGAVSSIGADSAEHLASFRAGRVGIKPRIATPGDGLRVKMLSRVDDFDPAAHFDRRQLSFLDRSSQFALVAAREAIAQTGGLLEAMAPERVGVQFSATVGYHSIEDVYVAASSSPPARPHPFTVPRGMASSAASQISMALKIRGPSFGVASACSSATHAMGLAFQMIRGGVIDAAVTGGCEAPFTNGLISSWEALRVLSVDTCRPFSAGRSGLVLGEGAGALVLEEMEHAKARGAKIFAEIVGFGMNADAADMTAPNVQNAAQAISAALADAGLDAAEIDYVSAHGTGTLLNDKSEAAALKHVFGARLRDVPVSSTKSMHGHCLSASGALGMVATTLALREGLVPPTMNFTEADPDCDLDCVPNQARQKALGAALCNSFAFGGLNAVLAVKAAA